MKKHLFTYLFVTVGLLLANQLAQAESVNKTGSSEEIFEARVIKIINEKTIVRDNGQSLTQQNILLAGLSGDWIGQEIIHQGISELDVLDQNYYRVGDRVLVQKSSAPDSPDQFYITDLVRRKALYWLAILFSLTVIIIGGFRGVKSLLSLMVSFFIIIKIILPLMLSGYNPLLISVLGSLAILAVIIYLTEGVNRKAHLAVVGVLLSLLITMVLSVLFTNWAKLTGLAQEETAFLITLGQKVINFKGLLLAGFLIGAVGVLDDIIVGQIETAQQIQAVNPQLTAGQVFKRTYQVGNTHLGAIVNTLFLTYAGAALPLLLLFTIKQEPFLSFNQVINNELIATEIVRTLVGSIGVAISMPISTFLGAYFNKKHHPK